MAFFFIIFRFCFVFHGRLGRFSTPPLSSSRNSAGTDDSLSSGRAELSGGGAGETRRPRWVKAAQISSLSSPVASYSGASHTHTHILRART